MTSPIVSDSQARANIARATRKAHSRLGRSPTHFRYSLLRAFDIKKTAIQAVFSRQLPTSRTQSARSVGIQMEVNHDVTGELERKAKRKDHALRDLFFLSS